MSGFPLNYVTSVKLLCYIPQFPQLKSVSGKSMSALPDYEDRMGLYTERFWFVENILQIAAVFIYSQLTPDGKPICEKYTAEAMWFFFN